MKKNLFLLSLALGMVSVASAIDGNYNYNFDNNQQFPSLVDVDIPEGGRSLLSPRVSAAGMLTGETDFFVREGLRAADSAATGSMGPFAGAGFSSMRHKSYPGSTDSDTWFAAAGAFKRFDNLFIAAAGLYGKTDFDLNDSPDAPGSGDAEAIAAALFVNWKDDKTGWHADGSAILGRMTSDYTVHPFSYSVGYSDKASYCSANVGVGREFSVGKGDNTMDVYARYYYGHSNASNVSVGGYDALRYNGVDSHRILVGARYIVPVTESTKIYVGTGWMYEMDGDIDANFLGTRTETCSVEGHSGMIEFGTRFNPLSSKNFTLDVSVSAWAGVQRGINLGFGGKYSF